MVDSGEVGIKMQAVGDFDNDSLRIAVELWCIDKKTALQRYGDISGWNTSKVTDMARLFSG